MRVAILSDIHDNVWNLAAALDAIRDAGAMICCGDLCSPFIIHQLARGFPNPIHVVFGNNDGDLFRITSNAAAYQHVQIHGQFFRGDLGGRSFAVNHYDNIARAVAASGEYDVVCYGHNHIFDITRAGPTLAINPGAIMGASFDDGGERTDTVPTFVIYDTDSDSATGFQIVASPLGAFDVARYPQ
ncbi:MAG: metallophosphoesterase family protein [Bryobacteraceae bacterium]|nr:metallophosphoesterase family protein [Bryobacteraceae bacterium]